MVIIGHGLDAVGARRYDSFHKGPDPFQCANAQISWTKSIEKNLSFEHMKALIYLLTKETAFRNEMMGVRRYLYRLLAFLCFATTVIASPNTLTAKDAISVIVGLDRNHQAAVDLQQYGTVDTVLYKAHAYAMTIPDEPTLEALKSHPGVEYVDYDGITMPMAKEEIGWGIPYIQAISDLIPPAAPALEQVSGCFRMCIVDGGLMASHPDIVRLAPFLNAAVVSHFLLAHIAVQRTMGSPSARPRVQSTAGRNMAQTTLSSRYTRRGTYSGLIDVTTS